MNKRFQDFLFAKPTGRDVAGLIVFVVFITFQPFYLQHEIIMMETGLHLPAINALFHGAVPYRDFFFLRGPVELYVPALMMKMGGINSAILSMFYYGGTILTLILCVILAGELFRTRIILYTMVPVFVARTFPRISYYYWGGLRYALGFIVLLCLFYFLKTKKKRWVFLTGVMVGLSCLTTPEAGFSTVVAVSAAFIFAWFFQVYEHKFLLRSLLAGGFGLTVVLIPYLFYMIQTGSLKPFIESNYVVLTKMVDTFRDAQSVKPENPLEFVLACIPGNKFFKYMSVGWCYIFFAGFLIYKIRQRKVEWVHAFLVGVMFYGLVLYAAAFRKIEGHHFEMALQAEKFIYFFLLEGVLFYYWVRFNRRSPAGFSRRGLVYYAALVVFISSLVYAFDRFDHRFTMVKLIEKQIFHKKKVRGLSLLEDQLTAVLNIDRARGHVVPRWQEQEIKGAVEFLQAHTKPNEVVFCYPEVGNFNFWADRPFVGRFPISTFAWMYGPWYQEFLNDFLKQKPHYVIMTNVGHRTFPALWYFRNPRNKERFEQMTRFILNNYTKVKSFESVGIYERKH